MIITMVTIMINIDSHNHWVREISEIIDVIDYLFKSYSLLKNI